MTIDNRFTLFIGCLLMGSTATSTAQVSHDRPAELPQLTVVADHGGQQARPYFVAINGSDDDGNESWASQSNQVDHAARPYGEQDMLPVISERLTPGKVTSRKLSLPVGFTPIFLIGDDALSRQWLAQRGRALRDMNAVGLVVQVKRQEGLEALRNAAQGLELRPVSGDGLAERLGLRHYPVLIGPHSIEQ